MQRKLFAALFFLWAIIFINITNILLDKATSNSVIVYPLAKYLSSKYLLPKPKYREIDNYSSPFKFLLAEHSNDKYSFEFVLPVKSSDKSSLWIYSGRAQNHGVANIEINGEKVGSIDLTLDYRTSSPIYELDKITDHKFNSGNNKVEIDVRSKNGDLFYAELGALVLADPEITKDQLLQILTKQQKGIDPVLYGLNVLFLFLSVLLTKKLRPEIKTSNSWAAILISILMLYCAFTWAPNIYLNKIESTGIVSEIHQNLNEYKDSIFKKIDNKEPVADQAVKEIENLDRFAVKVYDSRRIDQSPTLSISESALWGFLQYAKFGCPKDGGLCIPHSKLIIVLTIIYMIGLWLAFTVRSKIMNPLWAIFALPLLGLFSLSISSGWDELYVNLRHSVNLANSFHFSINSSQLIEATVDTLPLAFCGLMISLFDVDPVNTILLVSLSGILFVFLASQSISRFYFGNGPSYLISSVVTATPCVLWVSGSGFFSPIFTGFMLLGFSYYILQQRRWIGVAFLILTFLIRTEGFLFGLLLISCEFLYGLWSEKNYIDSFLKRYKYICVFIISFVLLTSCRYWIYEEILPIPVIFKNTGFNYGYISSGIGRLIESANLNLITILIINYIILSVFIKYATSDWVKFKYLFIFQIPFLLFTAPYFIGGGDWFNVYWNRYAMPITVYYTLGNILAFTIIIKASIKSFSINSATILISMIAILVSFMKFSIEHENTAYSVIARSIKEPDIKSWDRVNSLANLGIFIETHTETSSVLASAEEATIMYYANRNMVGMLGVSNPIIAKSKLDPMTFGDILHRKRAIKSLDKDSPDLLLLFEPAYKIDKNFKRDTKGIEEYIQKHFFNTWMNNITTYRYGGIKNILSLGYSPIAVLEGDYIYIIFSKTNTQTGLSLDDLSYLTTVEINFPVDSKVASKFMEM